MKQKYAMAILILLEICLWGCESAYYTMKEISPDFDYTDIRKIAVLRFENYTETENAGRIIADEVETWFVRDGFYHVITRRELEVVLEEVNLSLSGIVDSGSAIEIGKILGVQALITGNVMTYSVEDSEWNVGEHRRYRRQANVEFILKLINTRTGQIIWSETGNGEWWCEGGKAELAQYPGDVALSEARERALTCCSNIVPRYTHVRTSGSPHGWIGVLLDDSTLAIHDVLPDSPAHRAGLLKGDVITKYNDIPLSDRFDLIRRIRRCRHGQEREIEVIRDGSPRQIIIIPVRYPSESFRKTVGRRHMKFFVLDGLSL
jgi:hypothetical protein